MNPNARHSGQPEPGLWLNLQFIPLHARGELENELLTFINPVFFFFFQSWRNGRLHNELTSQATFLAQIFNN